jgi:hypothetical protein
VIRIEPVQLNFLEIKSPGILCKIPPLNTYVELVDVTYLKHLTRYITVNYQLRCHLVASCKWMYNDSRGSTELKTYHIIKTMNGFYFLVEFAEQHKYIIRRRNKSKMEPNVK